MVYKKPTGERVARPRLSLASRLLGGAVRATLQAPPPAEPWWNGKPPGKNRGKKHK